MNPLLLGPIIESVGKIADDLITTDKERAEAALSAYNAETQRMSGQVEINKIEAGSSSLFVSGWRPAIGWIGALAMAYQFLLYPLMVWCWHAAQAGGLVSIGLTEPPQLQTDSLWVILTGMLGLGVARTVEKVKGVAS